MRRGVLGKETMQSVIASALSRYPGSIPGCCADDQNFLTMFMWDRVKENALSMDSSGRCFSAKVCKDFPVGPRPERNFVGFAFKAAIVASEECNMTCT